MKLLRRASPFAVILAAALLLLNLPDIAPERYTDLASFFGTERGRQGFVGYTVAAVESGSLLYVDAFGTDGRGLPLETSTPMAIGSLSMSFTGLLALSLEEEGLVDLDAPLAAYLPELGLKSYASGEGPAEPAALRHFLSHTSGYSDLDFDDRHRGAAGLSEAAAALSAARPRAAPGREFRFINTGYQALGLLLESRAGRPYPVLLHDRVLSPLGMDSTRAPGGEGSQPLPLGSSSFFGAVIPRQQELPAFSAPSGGLVSTAPDMAKYIAYLVAPERARARFGRLPAEAGDLRRLREPLAPGAGYSYGWWVGEGGASLSHGGSLEGFSATAALWPERGSGVVILAPENSILQSLVSLPALVEGARRIMEEGEAERPFPLGRLYILLAIAAAVHLVVLAAQTGGALAWARDLRSRADAAGSPGPLRLARLRMLAGIALRAAALAALPALLELFFGRRMDWAAIFGLEPALGGWFAAAAGFGALRNLSRLAWLRSPRG